MAEALEDLQFSRFPGIQAAGEQLRISFQMI